MDSFPLTRVDAVDGKTIDISQYVASEAYKDLLTSERNGYRMRHYELTRGAVGCYLSHIKAYEMAASKNTDYVMIFEDDVRLLTNDIAKELNEQLKTIPSDWDVLLLGCVCFVCGKFEAHYEANRFILLHGYVVKCASLPNIISLLKGNPIKQQLDAELSDLVEENKLKVYCLRKKLAMQFNMGTNIQLPILEDTGINPFEPFSSKNV
jgi:GR25 family glycosyltransferase involved in LPS biosynthesis